MTKPFLLMIHTDGAARGNPGPAAFAYTIERDGEDPIEEAGKLGRMTNNQAEYLALVHALEHALELGAHHHVVVHSDSELLVKQMRGEYRVKNADLRALYEKASALSGCFQAAVEFRHVRREDNRRADALGNEALDGLREPTPRASNTPRADGKSRTPPATPAAPSPSLSLRDEAVAHLRQAAAAWSSGAVQPTPEQVWDQLVALLQWHGLPVPPARR